MIALAVAAAAVLALLLIPVRICVSYRGSFSLRVKVLFLRFDLYPLKKKKPEAEPKENTKEEFEQEPKEEPKEENRAAPSEPNPKEPPPPKAEEIKPPPPKAEEGPEPKPEEKGVIDKFLEYYEKFAELFTPFKRILRKLLRLEFIGAKVRVGTRDADRTAVYTGMLWGVAYNILGLLARFVTIERHSIEIEPAYNTTALSAEGECIIRLNLANIISAAAIAAAAYLRFRKKNKKQEEQKNERTSVE